LFIFKQFYNKNSFSYKTVSLNPLTDKNDLIWSCAKHDWGKNPIDPSSSFCTSNVDFPIRLNKRTWSPRITENIFVPFVVDNNEEFLYSCQTRYERDFFDCLSRFIDDDDDVKDEEYDEENDSRWESNARSESSSIAAKLSSPKTWFVFGNGENAFDDVS